MPRALRRPSNGRSGRGRGQSQPARTSWIDALLDWIESLPGPAWLFYAGVTLVFVCLGHGLRWLDGSLPVGQVEPLRFAADALAVYALALLHYLNRTARESLEAFRPALGKLDAEYTELQDQLTRIPQGSFLLAAALGLLLSLWSLAADPTGWGLTPGSSLVSRVFAGLQACLIVTPFVVFLAHSIRQLRLITYIHRASTGVSLYARETHHAFSRLTVRASIGLVLPIYWYSFVSYLTHGVLGSMSIVDTGTVIFVLLTSGAIFILPLRGMHRRLQNEKSRLIQEVDWRLEAMSRRLHSAVDSGAFAKTRDVAVAMSALKDEKQQLRTISTWPWDTATLRGFLSSIGLPVLLWLITRYLGRLMEN